jgi:signal transduction histidine kinase
MKKHSSQGGLVSTCRESEIEKFISFEIHIIDTGNGISKEGLKKLFVNFSKLAENSSENEGGTGLGLSICK